MARITQQTNALDQAPELVFRGGVQRETYVKRWRWALVAMIAGGGIWYILTLPLVSDAIKNTAYLPITAQAVILNMGQVIGALVVLFAGGRFAINLVYASRRKTQRMKFYDRGFVWERDGETHKYSWNAVKTVREFPGELKIAGRVVRHTGGVTLKMRDGTVFTFTPIHGNVRDLIRRVSPYYAEEIGIRMGQAIRMGKTIQIHPQIAFAEQGLRIGDKTLSWARVNLDMTDDERDLLINRFDKQGNIKPVVSIPTAEIDNLGGFLEIATTTIENHQRETRYKRSTR